MDASRRVHTVAILIHSFIIPVGPSISPWRPCTPLFASWFDLELIWFSPSPTSRR